MICARRALLRRTTLTRCFNLALLLQRKGAYAEAVEGLFYPPMSAVTRELQRRLRDEKSILRFEPCLPKPAKVPSLAARAARSNGARRR